MNLRPLLSQPVLLLAVCVTFSLPDLRAQQDAPPVNLDQLREALAKIKEQQAQVSKAQRERAIQDVKSAASSGQAAAVAWEEAFRRVQFDGSPREGTQFRDWKDKDGDALSEKEAQNAARLYFAWLGITLQRGSGVPVKDLLPQVIAYTREVMADQATMDALERKIEQEKEAAARPGGKKGNSDKVKQMHDQILQRPLSGGAPAQAYGLASLLETKDWEQTPGNVDGIFQQIILPVLRDAKDPTIVDYWDARISREAEVAGRKKLALDVEKFNQIRRPELLWGRAEDMLLVGLRNRALGEMFAVVKSYPAHPKAEEWLKKLETLVSSPADSTAATP